MDGSKGIEPEELMQLALHKYALRKDNRKGVALSLPNRSN